MQMIRKKAFFYPVGTFGRAYIKWTGEGLSRDLRTISLDEGSYILFRSWGGITVAPYGRRILLNYGGNMSMYSFRK